MDIETQNSIRNLHISYHVNQTLYNSTSSGSSLNNVLLSEVPYTETISKDDIKNIALLNYTITKGTQSMCKSLNLNLTDLTQITSNTNNPSFFSPITNDIISIMEKRREMNEYLEKYMNSEDKLAQKEKRKQQLDHIKNEITSTVENSGVFKLFNPIIYSTKNNIDTLTDDVNDKIQTSTNYVTNHLNVLKTTVSNVSNNVNTSLIDIKKSIFPSQSSEVSESINRYKEIVSSYINRQIHQFTLSSLVFASQQPLIGFFAHELHHNIINNNILNDILTISENDHYLTQFMLNNYSSIRSGLVYEDFEHILLPNIPVTNVSDSIIDINLMSSHVIDSHDHILSYPNNTNDNVVVKNDQINYLKNENSNTDLNPNMNNSNSIPNSDDDPSNSDSDSKKPHKSKSDTSKPTDSSNNFLSNNDIATVFSQRIKEQRENNPTPTSLTDIGDNIEKSDPLWLQQILTIPVIGNALLYSRNVYNNAYEKAGNILKEKIQQFINDHRVPVGYKPAPPGDCSVCQFPSTFGRYMKRIFGDVHIQKKTYLSEKTLDEKVQIVLLDLEDNPNDFTLASSIERNKERVKHEEQKKMSISDYMKSQLDDDDNKNSDK